MYTLKEINQKTRDAYNNAAEKYNELFFDELDKKNFDKNFLDDFLKHFNSNSMICDAGCGPCGHVADYINKKGIKVIGIDISEKCIEIARCSKPEIEFEVGDFSRFRFGNNYFEGIISYYSLINIPKIYIKNILNEFNRVLKTNGYLLLAVKGGEFEGLQDELLGIETEIYLSLYTKKEIETYLIQSGFKIIKLEERTPYFDEININRIFTIAQKVT